MNYKRIIKNRNFRIKIMQILNFIPDKLMIRMQYYLKTGNILNLKNPQRYTEKLQWYKLYYRDELMKQCVDKYDVRQYINNIGLGEILTKCYGVYNKIEEIHFEELPKSFVLKDTLGGGGNSILIVPDKNKVDWNQCRREMQTWLEYPCKKKHPGREWVYDNKQHRILIEELLEDDEDTKELVDYKFFCFNGVFSYLYVIADRELGKKAGVGIYNRDFEKLNYSRCDEDILKKKIQIPKNYKKMIQYAEKIAAPFPHARIDLYNLHGEIKFGEITFFDGSGYMKFNPDKFDYLMGDKFKIGNDK